MVKIKICGITDRATAEFLAELKVDFIGFVFANSSRQISSTKAAEIARCLPKQIKKVGVFVNEKRETIKRIVEYCNLDIVQLHGNEEPNQCLDFKQCQVIKAFKIKSHGSLKTLNNYPVDYLLLDSFSATTEGGTGQSFNWNLLKEQTFKRPVILAGGLNSDNVKNAINIVNPYAIDVSSGVETEGVKDLIKIRQLVEVVRGASYVA